MRARIREFFAELTFHDLLTCLVYIFFAVVFSWLALIVLFVRFVIVPILRYIRAICSRWRYCTRLKRLCRRKGLKCRLRRPRLLSLFFRYRGSDILLCGEEKRYSVKFFSRNPVRRIVHLRGLDGADTLKYYVMPVVTGRHAKWMWAVPHSNKRLTLNEMEYGRRRRGMKLEFEPESDKILLIQPSPLRMTALVGNSTRPIGSGDRIEEVAVYEGDDFLCFLNRTL